MPNEVEVARLPVPEQLEQPNVQRMLLSDVRKYFYDLYNAPGGKFKDYLASVGNKDSLTKNRWFDRHCAVQMIKQAAKEARDQSTLNAPDGKIWQCVVHVMSKHQALRLKDRRLQYRQLTQAAE